MLYVCAKCGGMPELKKVGTLSEGDKIKCPFCRGVTFFFLIKREDLKDEKAIAARIRRIARGL